MDIPRPFVVAHRAGNDRARLRAAETRALPVIEADLHLYRTRVDVRHGRRLGRLPVLYDEGRLRPARAAFTLDELLAESSASTTLLLDLKGSDVRLSERVLDSVEPHLGNREVAVCARAWRLLEPFRHERRVRAVSSVGSRRELRAFLAGPPPHATGVSIRDTLVDAETVRRLRRRADDVVLCWTVKSPDRAAQLASWGVDGVMMEGTDRLADVQELGRALRAARALAPADANDSVVTLPRLSSPVAVARREVEAAVRPELCRTEPAEAREDGLR
jgi:glycerophosphoryl diester phosphodiesterase